jgi:excinuclease ABC subunit C
MGRDAQPIEPAATDVRDPQVISADDPWFRSAVLHADCRQWHAGMALTPDLQQCRTRLRRLCPTTPGVYYWFDPAGHLVYVGKAKSLRNRLQGYFQSTPTEDKMRRIREISTRLVWEETSHEFLALVREQEAIIDHRPSWNVQGQPKRQRFAFLCLSKHRAPNLYVTFDQTPNADIYFGPILGSGRLREVAEALNHHFALRDCTERTPMDFSQQLLLFPLERDALCLRHEIGTCLGPCAAKVSAEDYQAAVARAVAFLRGYDRSLLQAMQRDMQQAAVDKRFEKAAALRDRLRLLQWADRRLEDLRRTRYEYNCVYRLQGEGGRVWWAMLAQGSVVAVVRQPSNQRQKQTARRVLEQVMAHLAAAGIDAGPLPATTAAVGTTTVAGTAPPTHSRGPRKIPGLAPPQSIGDWGPLRQQVPQLLMQSITQRWFRRQRDEKQNLLSYRAACEQTN